MSLVLCRWFSILPMCYGMRCTNFLALARGMTFNSTCGTQPTPPHFFPLEVDSKKISAFFTAGATSAQRRTKILRLCYTRYLLGRLVLIRLGCIVYLLYTPNPPNTANHTSLTCVEAHHHIQLEMSHHVRPVLHEGLRTHSSFAPVSPSLSCYVWHSILRALYLVL